MVAIKYLIRYGMETDRQALQSLLAHNNMETIIEPSEFLLAEIDGEIAGAIRLEYDSNDAYIRPIVVASKWRGKSIGRVLLNRVVQSTQNNLYAIARGSAKGFYLRMGFQSTSWDRISEKNRLECASCPDFKKCHPVPMVLTRTGSTKVLSSNNHEEESIG